MPLFGEEWMRPTRAKNARVKLVSPTPWSKTPGMLGRWENGAGDSIVFREGEYILYVGGTFKARCLTLSEAINAHQGL